MTWLLCVRLHCACRTTGELGHHSLSLTKSRRHAAAGASFSWSTMACHKSCWMNTTQQCGSEWGAAGCAPCTSVHAPTDCWVCCGSYFSTATLIGQHRCCFFGLLISHAVLSCYKYFCGCCWCRDSIHEAAVMCPAVSVTCMRCHRMAVSAVSTIATIMVHCTSLMPMPKQYGKQQQAY